MSPKVVLLGAGNVAFHLGRVLTEKGIRISQIYNRSHNGLQKIAAVSKSKTTTDLNKIELDADMYIIAVADNGIASTASLLSQCITPESIVVHTSGSTSVEVLLPFFKNSGVLYPLQSLNKELPVNFENVPLFITANNDITKETITILADQISNKVRFIEDEQRIKLHVPAVVVNNFVNHLYAYTYDFCQEESLELDYLLPLIEETANRLKEGRHPAVLQTGPAIRKDHKTIKKHREHLSEFPEFRKLYNYITRSIQNYHENRS